MVQRTISVVIPVHDRLESLREAVRSALNQTRSPQEIVIVDDASHVPVTAATLGIDDPRITIVRLAENRGAAGARMAGVAAARSELIAFLDSDDVFLPAKLEAQHALIEDDPLIAVSCGWDAHDAITGRTYHRIPIESADPRDFASGCWFSPGATIVVPKQAFAIVGPFDPALRRLEDLDWFLRFALAGGRLRVAPIIGAKIGIGRRANAANVIASANIIERKFAENAAIKPELLRRLRGWLHVEKAVAMRNDGRTLSMLLELARSFVLVPRTRLQLRRWWDRRDP